MSNKKELILEAARTLFNEHGTAAVSTHNIAGALGISQGNLTYHFPHKRDIIEALYLVMVSELERMVAGLSQGIPGLQAVFTWTREQTKLQLRFRFLWLEFAHIRKQYPAIDAHFSDMIRQRQSQFGFLLDMLQETGDLIKPEEEAEISWLFQQILVLGNFWLHTAEVFPPEGDPITHYSRLTLAPLLPYLTDQGKRIWKNFEEGQKNTDENT